MRYWWVNQNQTYRHEVPGGYLWSPKTRSDGVRNHFYDTMTQAQPGDIVFSFADTWIKAIGVVKAPADTAPKPTEFGSAGATWADEGWFLPVEFKELQKGIRPKDHIELLQPLLPGKYSPLQATGDGNQGVYLTELPQTLAAALAELIGPEFELHKGSAQRLTSESADDAAEAAVKQRADIPETHKLQLVKARRGQGLFRSRVELLEPCCRVTGVADREHLRASHILPWRDASDPQKLDGHNGLMLSPHVDHLFDQGFITFQDDGKLVASPKLGNGVLAAWGISAAKVSKPFTPDQSAYLAYHRDNVFQK